MVNETDSRRCPPWGWIVVGGAVLAVSAAVLAPRWVVAEEADQDAAARAERKAATSAFLRLVRNDQGEPAALETAIVHYVPRDCGRQGPTVDLIAAVHIGEKEYYEQLNRRFADYDVVLYELVAPEGTRIERGDTRNRHPVSALQRGMKNLLELSFQLEEIDYTAKNLLHADMSPEQFAESMRTRGESMWSMFLRMMGYAMAQQGKSGKGPSDLELLMALFNPNRAMALKRVLAEQFEDMEGSMLAIEGPEGSTLISERNKVAIEKLQQQLDAGRQKVAIFYGAGHMSDFQTRLKEQFGLAPVKTDWLVAWNLKRGRRPAAQPDAAPSAKNTDGAAPADNPKTPADKPQSRADQTEPPGDKPEPAADKTRPAGDKPQPAGADAEPSGDETQPPGAETR